MFSIPGKPLSVFACKAHSRKGLSVHRSTLEHFRLFLLWLLIPPGIVCGRFPWAAVGSELWALELMPKGCSSFFPQPPTSFCGPDLQRTLRESVIKTLLYKRLDSAAQSLLLQRVTTLNSLWNLATVSDIHTSSVLHCVERFMFCPEYA